MGKEPDEIRQDIEDTRARMGDAVDAIGYKADVPSRAKEKVTGTTDAAVSRVRETKDRVVESIAGTGRQASSRIGERSPSAGDVRAGTRRAVGIAQENPIGLAVGSVAAGFLLGMMFRSSEIENEKLGPVADQVKDAARDTGREALQRGQQVAHEVAQSATETARSSAQQQGQELASSTRERAQETDPR